MMITAAPGYTKKVFIPSSYQELVDSVEAKVKELRATIEFNALAGSGNSGVLLLGTLGYMLGLPILAVRKRDDRAHDYRMVNGSFPNVHTKYLIIDDLIDSGQTINHIIDSINKAAQGLKVGDSWLSEGVSAGYRASCSGILLYAQYPERSSFNGTPTFYMEKP